MMKTIEKLRMEQIVDAVNKNIAPCYVTVKRKINGQYEVVLSDDYAQDWICTGTYHEAIVALMALKVARNYF